ncbi:MAG: hypothetical protein ACRDK9_08720 [Solirubrobacterales bacterium]
MPSRKDKLVTLRDGRKVSEALLAAAEDDQTSRATYRVPDGRVLSGREMIRPHLKRKRDVNPKPGG